MGGAETAWGRFYDKLPWPKRDRKKAEDHLRKAIELNPHVLRARVYLASSYLDADRAPEAKHLLDEVAAARPWPLRRPRGTARPGARRGLDAGVYRAQADEAPAPGRIGNMTVVTVVGGCG